MSDDPFSKGVIILGLGIMGLVYKIYRKQRFKMSLYNTMEWKAFINSWALIIMLIISGFFLIIKSF